MSFETFIGTLTIAAIFVVVVCDILFNHRGDGPTP